MQHSTVFFLGKSWLRGWQKPLCKYAPYFLRSLRWKYGTFSHILESEIILFKSIQIQLKDFYF